MFCVSATNSPLEDCLSLFPVVRLTSICLFCALNGSCTHVWLGRPIPHHDAVGAVFGPRVLSELRVRVAAAALAGPGARSPARGAPAALRAGPRSSVRSLAVGSAARGLSAAFAGLPPSRRGLPHNALRISARVGCRAEVLASTAAKTGRPSSSVEG